MCLCVSPLVDSNWLIQQTGSECDRNVFSFQMLVGEAATASLLSSLFSAFSKPVTGMSSYVDPVLSATHSFVQVASVKQQINKNKSIPKLETGGGEGAGLRHI